MELTYCRELITQTKGQEGRREKEATQRSAVEGRLRRPRAGGTRDRRDPGTGRYRQDQKRVPGTGAGTMAGGCGVGAGGQRELDPGRPHSHCWEMPSVAQSVQTPRFSWSPVLLVPGTTSQGRDLAGSRLAREMARARQRGREAPENRARAPFLGFASPFAFPPVSCPPGLWARGLSPVPGHAITLLDNSP